MATLNKNLKDYLSNKSQNNTASSKGRFTSFFSKQDNDAPEEIIVDETSNGWFSEAKQDPCLPSLTKKQRVIGFFTCLLLGTFCFSLASLYVPFLLLKARKFAMLYTLGSLFIISSFSLLWGPLHHLKHLFSADRLPFTSVYFGTMFATIYFSVWMKSTLLTVVFAVIQILALVWYIVSYIPGGNTGLKFFTKIFYSAASTTVSKTLPV